MRRVAPVLVALVLGVQLALAEPAFRVLYLGGVPWVEIVGDFSRSSYLVSRADSPDGVFTPITDGQVLCLGSCFALDYAAEPGRTYWYRFDLLEPDGSTARFGPYAATISPSLAARARALVFPNPGRGPTRVEMLVFGAPGGPAVEAEATLFDASGRRIRSFWRGRLPAGTTTLTWDGRDGSGRELAAGTYFLRFRAGRTERVTRVVRVH